MRYFFLLLLCSTFSLAIGQEKLTAPLYLKAGDTIAILAPAGILKGRAETIQKAKELAQSWGLNVVLGENLFNQNNHFAGTDDERAEDFQKALDNPNIKAIWAARGGYGSVRLLDRLDFTKFMGNPKWIIGYSDITAFHNHVHNLGFETLHAMMATSLEEKPEEITKTISSCKKALFGEQLSYSIPSSNYNRLGEVSGQLIGGNLAIVTSMLGSKSQLDTKDKILFLEEIGEYKYSIDRMLQSLKRANYFSTIKAVIIGDISLIKNNTTKWGSSVEQLILDALPKDIPILFDFPAGHEPDNRAMIFGRKIKMTVNKGNQLSTVIFEY